MPKFVIFLLFVLGFTLSQPALPQNFTFRLQNMWSSDTHPVPISGELQHFSPFIIIIHNDQVNWWSEGGIASTGLFVQSTNGTFFPWLPEVQSALDNGTVDQFIRNSELTDPDAEYEVTFTASPSHPFLSIATMLAETPDFFVGVASFPLTDGDDWISTTEIELFPYDAGVDDGTILQFLPDFPTTPQAPIAFETARFGGLPPVGTLRIENNASVLTLSFAMIFALVSSFM